MSFEPMNTRESKLRRVVELRWQCGVIARWVDCYGISVESQAQLQEMLIGVNSELQVLEASLSIDDEGDTGMQKAG